MKVLKFTITTLLLSLFISFRSSAAYMPPALPSSGADSAVFEGTGHYLNRKTGS